MNRIFAILIAIVVAAAVAGGFVTDATPRKSPDTSHLSGVMRPSFSCV